MVNDGNFRFKRPANLLKITPFTELTTLLKMVEIIKEDHELFRHENHRLDTLTKHIYNHYILFDRDDCDQNFRKQSARAPFVPVIIRAPTFRCRLRVN